MFVERAVQHLFDALEHIGAGEEKTDHRKRRQQRKDRPGAPHHQKFGDKSAQPRQPQRGHRGEDQDAAVDRNQWEQTAEFV